MSCICQRSLRLASSARAFSTSSRQAANLGLGANDPKVVADVVPAYPPGPTRWYKQSAKGLYGGQKVRFGNNTSEEYRTRTRRSWGVNVKDKNLYSNALGRYVKLRTTTRVMRTIDKLGGLDEYLLGEKDARIKELGETGWWLRWAIMQTHPIQQRFRKQRQALGLASPAGPTQDQPATNPVLGNVERKRCALKFRVGRLEYVTLRGNKWVPVASRRRSLVRLLKRLSPTPSLQEWEELEHERTTQGRAPYPENIRLQWFRLRQTDYTKVLAEYKMVDQSEEMTSRDRERERSLDNANDFLLEWRKKKGEMVDAGASQTVKAASPEPEAVEAAQPA